MRIKKTIKRKIKKRIERKRKTKKVVVFAPESPGAPFSEAARRKGT
jgi:hypothetical protein